MKTKLIKSVSFRKLNKAWASLAAAIVIGMFAALAARSVLGDRVDTITTRLKAETVEVVVVREAMRQGTPLSRHTLSIRTIPAEYAQSNAVQPRDFYRIDGRAVAYDLKGGDMLMWSQLERPRALTLSERLRPGQRAVTVVVDEFNAAAGALQPGDLIDLMHTAQRDGRKVVVPLLQAIQVMATGQRAVDDPASGVTTRLATVTLNATPEQARHLIMARESGRLTALLRNPHDRPPTAHASRDRGGLGDAIGHASAHTVPVLYGDALRPARHQPSAP